YGTEVFHTRFFDGENSTGYPEPASIPDPLGPRKPAHCPSAWPVKIGVSERIQRARDPTIVTVSAQSAHLFALGRRKSALGWLLHLLRVSAAVVRIRTCP